MSNALSNARIAVVIPCYKVSKFVGSVISAVPESVERIYCVDDACPEGSGEWIRRNVTDPRVTVLRHEVNKGVGGAVITGYRQALADGLDIAVKVDGDGQMNPALVPRFVMPIAAGFADYTKGNRFYRVYGLRNMPRARLFGNAILSFMTKISTGYWNIFDPTNGYTAISTAVLEELPLDGISNRYFFETDMLYHLSIIRAVVEDIPMDAHYADEESNLRIGKILFPFLRGHLRNSVRRFLYSYLIRDFSVASVQILLGVPLLLFGTGFGVFEWIWSARAEVFASAGSVMLAALPVIVGLQLVLSAISYDIANVPRRPLTPMLRAIR